MRFVFQRYHDIVESFDVGGCYACDNRSFQVGQVATNAPG